MNLLAHAHALTWGDLPTHMRVLVLVVCVFGEVAAVFSVVTFWEVVVLWNRAAQEKKDV